VSEPWRTTTVVALCEAMRQTRDYSGAPILADALEDSEYPDGEVLRQLRSELEAWQAERLVALIYSDKTAEAVNRVEEIAMWLGPGAMLNLGELDSSLAMDYRRLLAAAHDWVDHKGGVYQWGGDRWEESFPSRAEEFWDNYHIITGRRPSDERESFFVCTC
jgi:hypothetical protein